MSNFVNDVINSNALLDEIDDYIELWHNSDSELSVFEYLGMSEKEYLLWVENNSCLKYIISAHKQNIPIELLLQNELKGE